MRDALAVHGALARGAFAVAFLVSLGALFSPGDEVPLAPPGVDKLVHLVLFLALAVTGRWAGVRATRLAAGLLVYAVLSEIVQAVTPLARSGSAGDLAADAVGVLLGLLGWWAAGRAAAGPAA